MADDITLQPTPATPPSGTVIATDEIVGKHYQKIKLFDGTADSATPVAADATFGLAVDVKRIVTVVVDTEMPAAAAAADASANPTAPVVQAASLLFNGTTWDRARAAAHGLDSTGIGVAAAAIVGEFDDTLPSAVTENQFAVTRITAARGLHANLRNVSGTEVGVAAAPLRVDPTGITTQPISAASLPLPAGASTLSEQQTQTTSLQLIDDVVHATNAALNKAVAVAGQLDDTTPTAATENNIAPARITAQRAFHVNLRDNAGVEIPPGTEYQEGAVDTAIKGTAAMWEDAGDTLRAISVAKPLPVNPFLVGKTLKTASISVAASGDNTIIAAVATKRLKVYAINFAATGTVSAKWKDGAATDLSGAQDFQAREGYTLAVDPPAWLLATTAGNAFILNLSGAIAVRGWVSYWDDDAT